MSETDPRIARLLDKQDCVELVHKLARAIDRCDSDLVREVFHPDATDDHGMFKGTAADFVPWVMEVLNGMRRTQHIIGNVLVEVDGNKAEGESYFIAHHVLPGGEGADSFMVAAGRYLDRFEKRNGEWKISHRHAVYDWSQTAAASDIWDRANAPGYVFGSRGTADASYSHFARQPQAA